MEHPAGCKIKVKVKGKRAGVPAPHEHPAQLSFFEGWDSNLRS